jgi:uncharacterized protein (DUF305 family)
MNNHTNIVNICNKVLTDVEFLQHMIPHHQVAIEMSKVLQRFSKYSELLYLVRNIIFSQTDEITYMTLLLKSRLTNNDKNRNLIREIRLTYLKSFYPELTKENNIKCEKHFFNIDPKHINHYIEKGLTDKQFIDHMIDHHQIAVSMSYKLIETTQNDQMRAFCYHIIAAQEYEIFLMKQMCDSYKYYSNKLCNGYE